MIRPKRYSKNIHTIDILATAPTLLIPRENLSFWIILVTSKHTHFMAFFFQTLGNRRTNYCLFWRIVLSDNQNFHFKLPLPRLLPITFIIALDSPGTVVIAVVLDIPPNLHSDTPF